MEKENNLPLFLAAARFFTGKHHEASLKELTCAPTNPDKDTADNKAAVVRIDMHREAAQEDPELISPDEGVITPGNILNFLNAAALHPEALDVKALDVKVRRPKGGKKHQSFDI